ncbi:MAG: Ldh family oxidoreductase [Dethiobacteria bacterium]|jgi:L-2-hydroxycarboxylate dehydrogenase (NAD+)
MVEKETKILNAAQIENFVLDVLRKFELPEEDAASVARVLVAADLRGIDSHGVARLPIYIERMRKGLINARPHRKLLSDRGAACAIDADNGLGAPAGEEAVQRAMEKAKEFGVACAVVRNTNHFGIGAYYAMMPLKEGMIGLCATNTSPLMVPFGGREIMLGSNPLAIAVPAGKRPPIVLDMATTAVARGKLELAKRKGEKIPTGWGVDTSGKPTTDPDEALKGGLLPMGGPKGSGLAMVIDILCGVLAGAAYSNGIGSLFGDMDKPQNIGNFFMVMDIGFFREKDAFAEEMERYVDLIKGSAPAEGFKEILMPGEIEWNNTLRREKEGIPISAPLQKELKALVDELGLSVDWLQ